MLEIVSTGERLPDSAQKITTSVNDNDLFVADVSALVTFHQLDGQVIREDLYHYQDGLQQVVADSPGIKGSKFYGWTTIPNPSGNGELGYSSITSTTLNDIKQKGELYATGDPVKKEMHLYPVFVNALTNVLTEFEGHQADVTKRDGVGSTAVGVDESGVYIDVIGAEADGNFPQGFRFKGWYKKLQDNNEVCVSRDRKYYVPDLTAPVTYVARFQYEVSYYIKAFKINNGNFYDQSQKYTSLWYDYEQPFKEIKEPAFSGENVIHWGTDHVFHDNAGDPCGTRIGSETKITEPIIVRSHNVSDLNIVANDYAVFMDSDFPLSGEIHSEVDSNRKYWFRFTPADEAKYHLMFWTLESGNKGDGWTFADNPMNTGKLVSYKNYEGRAFVMATLTFHGLDGAGNEKTMNVNRRYEDQIFLEADKEFQCLYPHIHTDKVVNPEPYDNKNKVIPKSLISEKSPDASFTDRPGYAFLGWISSAEVERDSFVWNYIYDGNDPYCTKDVEKVKPYLISTATKVHEAQDLYPVYAKYDVTVDTNIHQKINITSQFNKPGLPVYNITADPVNPEMAQITVTAEDGITPVLVSEPGGTKYSLTTMTCEVDGEVREVQLVEGTGNAVYTGQIKAGKSYKFVAHYTPLLISYHINDNDEIQITAREYGDKLGASFIPDYSNISGVSRSCFVGWADQKPQDSVVYKFNGKDELVASGIQLIEKNHIVKHNMDLYPVFVMPTIRINSNIDDIITGNGENPEDYRNLQHGSVYHMQLYAKDYPGYKFMGWHTDYVDAANQGTLVSENSNIELKDSELFVDKTYTAVYQKAYQVKYYDLDRNLLYVANVVSGSRGFVDENGNAIDTDPIFALQEKLTQNQIFSQWQWNNNGTMVKWKDFCKVPIEQDMDIYPEICTISAKDSENNNYTGRMLLTYVESRKIDPTAPEGTYTVTGLFTEEYNQPFLTLCVHRESWNPEATQKADIPIQNIPTRMFVDRGTQQEHKYQEASQGPVYTDTAGNAKHEFIGKLVIKKTFSGDSSISERVYFVIESQEFSTMAAVDVKNGSGEISLNLPVGNYTIREDSGWSWRDVPKEEVIHTTIKMSNENMIEVDNERVNRKWFTGEDHIINRRK